MLEGDPEVQELIVTDRSEALDRVVDQDHPAVDARPLNLPQPTLRDLIARKHLRG
jgi:hypothetical protein